VCVQRWAAEYPADRVVEEIVASPGHFAWIVAESNGLGQPLANQHSGLLWRRFAARPPETGGGVRQRVVMIEESGRRPERRPERSTRGPVERTTERFVTRKVACHVTAEQKAATYSALRLLIGQERLLIPASAEELRRELLLLRVDLAPSGVERVEASRGHDDCADSLALSLLPYRRSGAGRDWGAYLAELAQSRRPLPTPQMTISSAGEMVNTGGGLALPRRPVWASVEGAQTTAPEVDADERASLSPALADARRRVAAALANDQRTGAR